MWEDTECCYNQTESRLNANISLKTIVASNLDAFRPHISDNVNKPNGNYKYQRQIYLYTYFNSILFRGILCEAQYDVHMLLSYHGICARRSKKHNVQIFGR